MNFDWQEYLTLAQELMLNPSPLSSGEEARARAAISRAYYAAFIEARNHLHLKEATPVPRRENPHWFVIEQFKNSSDKIRRDIGANLERLRLDRNSADYQNQFFAAIFAASTALIIASNVINDLKKL
jgi:uncharacterized protein (UPF0332 family)